jgi:hypothetical protein
MKVKLNMKIGDLEESEIIELTDADIQRAIESYSAYKDLTREEMIVGYVSDNHLIEFVFDSIDAWPEIMEE